MTNSEVINGDDKVLAALVRIAARTLDKGGDIREVFSEADFDFDVPTLFHEVADRLVVRGVSS